MDVMSVVMTHKTGCTPLNKFKFISGRMPQSGKLPVLNLLTGQKSGFSPRRGDFVAPIHVKLGRANGHVGPLGYAKFHLNRHRGGNAAQNIKNFHFLVKSRPHCVEWDVKL